MAAPKIPSYRQIVAAGEESARRLAARQEARTVVSFGTIRIIEDEPTGSGLPVVGTCVDHPPVFLPDSFGGWTEVPMVTGPPVTEHDEPPALRLKATFVLDGVDARVSVEPLCVRLEGLQRDGGVIRLRGALPLPAPSVAWVIEQLTPSEDPKRVWWDQTLGARLMQGYEAQFMAYGADRTVVERPAARRRRKAAKTKGR